MKQHTRRSKSKRYLWQGFTLLGMGSALLLSCKFIPNPAWQSVLLFGGGGAILLGNGFMLYGLLHHADDRTYDDENQQAAAPLQTELSPAEPTPASPARALNAKPSPLQQERECG